MPSLLLPDLISDYTYLFCSSAHGVVNSSKYEVNRSSFSERERVSGDMCTLRWSHFAMWKRLVCSLVIKCLPRLSFQNLAWCFGPTGMSRDPASWDPPWRARTWGLSSVLTSWHPMDWLWTTKRRSSTFPMEPWAKLRDVTTTVPADMWVWKVNSLVSL